MDEEQNLLSVEQDSKDKTSSEVDIKVEGEHVADAVENESRIEPQIDDGTDNDREERERAKEIAEAPSATPQVAEPAPAQKDKITQEIEGVLSEDLNDLFLALTPEKRTAFKIAGEETALKIRNMMKSGKVKAKKILDLIQEWLRIVPGVNKFFLEQEAKIKTDKLMSYYVNQSKQNDDKV